MSKLNQLMYVKDMDVSESDADNEDVWDDKKLNDAYDKALKIANAEVAKRVAMSTNTCSKDGNKSTSPLQSKQQKPKDKKKQQSKEGDRKPQWKVGMPCRAIYEEDGLEYEAVVLRIMNKDCVIRFLGYNNTEIVPLNTLKQTHGKEARTEQIEQAICDQGDGYNEDNLSHEEYMETEGEGMANVSGNARSQQKKTKTSARKKKPQHHGQDYRLPELPNLPMGMPMGMPGSIPNPSFFKNLNIDMPMPPIPPPSLPTAAVDSEDQAISSMLLSWYMSGYYTGLYRGLRRAKESRKH